MDYIGNELELFKGATNWKSYFASRIAPFISGDVLEVGAGIGANLPYLVTPKVESWTLLEPDATLLELVDYPDGYKEGFFIPVTGTLDSSSEEEAYDTILYIDVLEHIEKSQEEVLKAKQILRKGGHLIILVPAFNFLYNEFDKALGHFRRYDKEILRSEINQELQETKIFYLDSMGLFASMANKYFLHKPIPSPGNIKLWDQYLVRFSKMVDPLILKSFGKSLIGIFQK